MELMDKTRGFLWGAVGILAFSFTIPATRLAAPELGSVFVGLGRAVIAAVFAGILLLVKREKFPAQKYWLSLGIVSLGIIVGFPLLTSYALKLVPAKHGAVLVGFAPALTAIMAVLRSNERPGLLFWLASALGVVSTFIFALVQGAGSIQPGDALLFLAIVLLSLGYAEGGKVSRELGSLQVISWSLVFSAPFLFIPVAVDFIAHPPSGSALAWACFAYISVVSMFLAYIAWYRGLALGGIAAIGQVQLVQPLLTLLWSGLLLGEFIEPLTLLAALMVIASVILSRRARVTQTTKKA
jgi:drug/metabolite transporter (DMT)-like permease